MTSKSLPLSPSTRYPRLWGSDLEAGGRRSGDAEVGDGILAAGEAEECPPGAVFDAEEIEDVQPQQSLKTPELPPHAVVEAHRIDHWPPRSWCKECNEGHGRERGHYRSEESHRVAIISMDYAFMTKKGEIVVEGDPGWDDEEALKLLVVKDSKSRAVFAHAVPRKGIDEKRYAVDMVVEDVLWLGYSKLLLKSDNEPAIVKLLKESLASLKVSGVDQAGEEHPPPYDSQANGLVEAAVKQVKARIRTLKLCLERRIGKRIPPRHPIVTWLAQHGAAILRYRNRNEDGKTPYERIRLRPFNTRLVAFGEKVSFKMKTKEPNEDEHRWHEGIFLGICPVTGQYILHSTAKRKVQMARTIKALPDRDKWSASDIEAVLASPYDLHNAKDQGVTFQDRPVQEDDIEVPRSRLVRKLYIKGEDIRAFGYTDGCPKCDHDQRYGPGRTTRGHSDACRARIVDCLSKSPEGQRRLAAADERANR